MKKGNLFIDRNHGNIVCTTKAISYPQTATVDTVDTYFGVSVPDPYRWLENDTSAATASWVKAQNEITNNYLEHIPFRQDLFEAAHRTG